jgi:hypothetical protein
MQRDDFRALNADNVLYFRMLNGSDAGFHGTPRGCRQTGDVQLGFDRRVRLEFHESKISSDGGPLWVLIPCRKALQMGNAGLKAAERLTNDRSCTRISMI